MVFMELSYSSAEMSPRAKRSRKIASAWSPGDPGRPGPRHPGPRHPGPRPLERMRTAKKARKARIATQKRSRKIMNGHQKPTPHPPIGPSKMPGAYVIKSTIFVVSFQTPFPCCTGRLGEQLQSSVKQRSRLDQDPRREIGKVKEKVAPSPTPGLPTHILPPIASTSAFEMASPTPDPPSLRERDFAAR